MGRDLQVAAVAGSLTTSLCQRLAVDRHGAFAVADEDVLLIELHKTDASLSGALLVTLVRSNMYFV